MEKLKTVEEMLRGIEYILSHPYEGSGDIHQDLLQHLTQERQDILDAVIEGLNKLEVYYRSKFSRNCSCDETEEEMSTEMLDKDKVITLVTELLSKQK